jgi:hypothetical protein
VSDIPDHAFTRARPPPDARQLYNAESDTLELRERRRAERIGAERNRPSGTRAGLERHQRGEADGTQRREHEQNARWRHFKWQQSGARGGGGGVWEGARQRAPREGLERGRKRETQSREIRVDCVLLARAFIDGAGRGRVRRERLRKLGTRHALVRRARVMAHRRAVKRAPVSSQRTCHNARVIRGYSGCCLIRAQPTVTTPPQPRGALWGSQMHKRTEHTSAQVGRARALCAQSNERARS